MKYYHLMIRVQNEYYPVNWDDARVCWAASGIKPTRFSPAQRELVHEEVVEIFKPGEYKWVQV